MCHLPSHPRKCHGFFRPGLQYNMVSAAVVSSLTAADGLVEAFGAIVGDQILSRGKVIETPQQVTKRRRTLPGALLMEFVDIAIASFL